MGEWKHSSAFRRSHHADARLGDRAHSPPRGGPRRGWRPPRRGARARAYTYTPTSCEERYRPQLGFAHGGPSPRARSPSSVPSVRPRLGAPRRSLEPDLRAGGAPLAGGRSRRAAARVDDWPPSFFVLRQLPWWRPASPSRRRPNHGYGGRGRRPSVSRSGGGSYRPAQRVSLSPGDGRPRLPGRRPRARAGCTASLGARAREPGGRGARASGVTPQRALFLPRSSRARGPGTSARAQTLDDMEYRELKHTSRSCSSAPPTPT